MLASVLILCCASTPSPPPPHIAPGPLLDAINRVKSQYGPLAGVQWKVSDTPFKYKGKDIFTGS